MHIGVVGINYKSADLALREVVAKAALKLLDEEREALERLNALILSTCNRTEIYFSGEDLAERQSEILQLLRQRISDAFEHALYSYFGADCFLHLARVTSGLDSVVLGESEIQRQVKIAYQSASFLRLLPSVVHFLFQKSLKIGKEMRHHFSFGPARATLEGTIFHVSHKLFQSLNTASILFVGNSEINRKILRFFKCRGAGNLTLLTRALDSAQELQERENVKLLPWTELSSWDSFELVICGTNRHDYLLSYDEIAKKEEIRTRLIFDLSVPRNVDPCLNRHPLITLLNLEEIGELLKTHEDLGLKEQAEENVKELVGRQLAIYHRKQMDRVCA